MKLVKSLLVLALLIPFVAISKPPVNKTKTRPCTKQVLVQLRNTVEYPEFAQVEELQGVVVVQFNILENSTVEVTGIQSNDDRLKDYVHNKLQGMKIPGAACDVEEMTMQFNFILE